MIVFVSSLLVYDLGLRSTYLKGEYTQPFNDYTPLNYKGFDVIELHASTAVNIKLVQGPFKVLANPFASDFLKVKQQGTHLIIDAAFGEHYNAINTDYVLYVSCPKLHELQADAYYLKKDVIITDTAANSFDWKPTLISGFNADSLRITENHAANIILEHNNINRLNAVVGINDRSRSNLTIGENNQFLKTKLDILNKSHLWIRSGNANNLNYHLADSATLVVKGAAAKQLLKL